MSNTRRIPFVLDLDDPTDAAIWGVLEPLIKRRRASAWLRRAAEAYLSQQPPSRPAPVLPAREVVMQDDAMLVRAKRLVRQREVAAVPEEVEDSPEDVERAARVFLNTFG